MKIEVGRISAITDILSNIATHELPAKTLYNILKVYKNANELSKPYIETRTSLFKKYNITEGEQYDKDDERWQNFIKELEEVASTKVEFNDKIKLSDIEDIIITGNEMFMLSDIIDEE